MNSLLLLKSFFIIFIILQQFNNNIKQCYASKKYNRYLAHIFNKYGNGGALSFEGLEHLMYNLGLGGLEFNLTHTIEEHHPDGYKVQDPSDILLPETEIGNGDHENTILIRNDEINTENNMNIDKNSPIKLKNSNFDENKRLDSSLTTNAKIEIEEKLLSSSMPSSLPQIDNFREMHDPKHRHPRHQDDNIKNNNNKCLSPKSLMKLVVDHDDLHRQRILNNMRRQNQEQYQYNGRISRRSTQNEHQNYNSNHNNNGNSNEQHDEEEEYDEFIDSLRITPNTFMKLCPALLVQIDQDACAQHISVQNDGIIEKSINLQEFGYAWIYATISIFIISCCGLVGIAIVPLIKTAAYNEILNFLVAIAIGTLCGDALMHLMPHALISEHHENNESNVDKSSEKHYHDNEPVWLCSCAFFTALFMYFIENLLPLLQNSNHNHHHHHHHHSHQQDHSHQHYNPSQENHQSDQDNHTNMIDMEIIRKQSKTDTTEVQSSSTSSSAKSISLTNLEPKEINTMLNEIKEDKKGTKLTPVAFMVIIGDGLHNLTDGLAIGAAFANDPVTGMATAFAVLCHELPHELGDFALLLQTGLKIKRAIYLNIISSILSFMGMACGLCIAGIHTNMVRWIYASTAGSFLYIAFADLIPEISRNKKTFKNLSIQISGILIGGIIMILIALNEDSLRLLFE